MTQILFRRSLDSASEGLTQGDVDSEIAAVIKTFLCGL